MAPAGPEQPKVQKQADLHKKRKKCNRRSYEGGSSKTGLDKKQLRAPKNN
jgi:hypothetical protein